jgi:hypothetical protein
MRFAFPTAAGLVFCVAYACEGGELDAFTQHPGGGGSSGRGGSASGGTSGVSGGGGEGGMGDSLTIDDFEDGDRFASLNDGPWYVSNDSTGNQTLAIATPSAERPGSQYSLHTSGVGFARFAAVVCKISGSDATFDASDYAAITFVARAEPGSAANIHLSFYVGNVNFVAPMTFGPNWEQHTIRFVDPLPVEDPNAVLDPRAITAIQFNVPPRVSFDFWLDDLAFVR